jgi:hypothetical protein
MDRPRPRWPILILPLLALPALAVIKTTALPTYKQPPATTRVAATQASDRFLHSTTLHTFHLKVGAKEWEEMQPTRGGLFSGLFAATRPSEEEAKHESPFGYQYSYVHAALEHVGRTSADIGLRF